MHNHAWFVTGGALLISSLGLLALVTEPGMMGPLSYAAVATVLLGLTLIVKMARSKARGTRTLAQLVTGSGAGLMGDRS
jgi:hypothetical protein